MTRELVQLSLLTRIPYRSLLAEDDRVIATYFDILNGADGADQVDPPEL